MRLADFIEGNTQQILDDAVEFAVTQAPEGAKLNHKRLRNDIPLILREIVADLRTEQSSSSSTPSRRGGRRRRPVPNPPRPATDAAVRTMGSASTR